MLLCYWLICPVLHFLELLHVGQQLPSGWGLGWLEAESWSCLLPQLLRWVWDLCLCVLLSHTARRVSLQRLAILLELRLALISEIKSLSLGAF